MSAAILPPFRTIRPRHKSKAERKNTEIVRRACYERAGGFCELRRSENCIPGVLPWDGPDPWAHGHLVHLKSKRIYGTSPEICAWGCWHCHLVMLHNPKPCPPKPRG